MTDALISFFDGGRFMFSLPSSLESLDACHITIPKRFIKDLSQTTGKVQMKITFLESENNHIKGDN